MAKSKNAQTTESKTESTKLEESTVTQQNAQTIESGSESEQPQLIEDSTESKAIELNIFNSEQVKTLQSIVGLSQTDKDLVAIADMLLPIDSEDKAAEIARLKFLLETELKRQAVEQKRIDDKATAWLAEHESALLVAYAQNQNLDTLTQDKEILESDVLSDFVAGLEDFEIGQNLYPNFQQVKALLDTFEQLAAGLDTDSLVAGLQAEIDKLKAKLAAYQSQLTGDEEEDEILQFALTGVTARIDEKQERISIIEKSSPKARLFHLMFNRKFVDLSPVKSTKRASKKSGSSRTTGKNFMESTDVLSFNFTAERDFENNGSLIAIPRTQAYIFGSKHKTVIDSGLNVPDNQAAVVNAETGVHVCNVSLTAAKGRVMGLAVKEIHGLDEKYISFVVSCGVAAYSNNLDFPQPTKIKAAELSFTSADKVGTAKQIEESKQA